MFLLPYKPPNIVERTFAKPLILYFVLKNLVLPRMAGSSMGLACPALRGSEFFGSAEKTFTSV